jgi:hypothetical protein
MMLVLNELVVHFVCLNANVGVPEKHGHNILEITRVSLVSRAIMVSKTSWSMTV